MVDKYLTVWDMYSEGKRINVISKALGIDQFEVLSLLHHLHSAQNERPIWTYLSWRPFRLLFEKGYDTDDKIFIGLIDKKIHKSFIPNYGNKSFTSTRDIYFHHARDLSLMTKNKKIKKFVRKAFEVNL